MMGTKKLLNTGSSPPIAYKRHSNKCEEEKPLQQQIAANQQHIENYKRNDNTNTTCLLQKQNTNKMFTKLRKYLTQFRTASTAALTATQKHCSQQPRKRHHHQHYRHQKLTECNSIPIVQSTSSMLSMISIVVTLIFLASINGVAANPVFVDNPSLAQFQSGRNIRHLPCIVRKSGRAGVCMFAIDCIKQNGTHLGTCIDRFYFGSCCDIKEEELTEIADNSIDQNTISHHFTSDSSTLPTSALFKLTTPSPLQQHENITTSAATSSNTNSIQSFSVAASSTLPTQEDVTQILNIVAQSLVANSINDTQTPASLNATKPFIHSTSTAKPSQKTTTTTATTHKQSHFVIRTTTKPTKTHTTGAKPSHNTTIKRKTTPTTTTKKTTTTSTTTTTTTTKRPILTTTDTVQQKENLPVETTTQPAKLFTYQIVETTAYTPTEEATSLYDFVTTERTTAKTTKLPPTATTTTTAPPKPTTTKLKETTVTSTSSTEAATAPTTQKITTIKTKPQTTRKTTTTKKPTIIRRTTIKPTRRPVTTTTTSPTDVKVSFDHTTEIQNFSISSAASASTAFASNKTTLAPRPRPKPTASIVKVPKPTTATTTRTPTTSTTTTEAEKIFTTTESATTRKPITTTTATTTTTAATTTTTTKATTTTTTTTAPRKTTTEKTTTSTTPRTTATTTHKTTTHTPDTSSTTHRPGLVTWTNIDGKPVDTNYPSISDWVPVTSQAPMNIHNKIEELPIGNVTYEEMDVSVSSSVSAVMNNTTVIISAPQKPVHVSKPTTSTTTIPSTVAIIITTTDSPFTTFRPNASSSSTATDAQQETSSTAEPSSSQFTTEGISPSTTTSPSGAFNTEEATTETFILNSTTTSPFAGLEGVDYRQVCGRRMFPEPRIVGGSNAAFGRWPWQISLRQWRTSTYLHKCGAALLNENWAITAAHCVDNVPPSDLLLRLGEYDLAEEEEPYGYQERRVQIVASHPQFDPRTFEYDLALLRFYEPVVFQPNIIPVCVPENDEDFIGQTAFVTGWGRLYEDGPLPSVLQEVAVPVINNTICESMYRAAGYIEHIPHIFICAGWKKGGYDSCEGDSGGPMVLQRESDKRFQLGGVISWGIGCAEANQPGVYTRISEFRDWINQILQF